MDNIKLLKKRVLGNDGSLSDTLFMRWKENLLILNYRPEVQYKNLWGPTELVCRGLIINRQTGEIVARPFDKFFNWGEHNRTTQAKLTDVVEKMDGSLGIHYRTGNKVAIATRGSFESEQALWATEFLNTTNKIGYLPEEWTLLFEIIYSDNKIVIDYDGWEGLVLLAIRNRFTGEYVTDAVVKSIATIYNFASPKHYNFSSPQEIITATETLPSNKEGWVVEFEDGSRFKFKGEAYRELHKLISGLSFKLILEHHRNGTVDQAKATLPDEFHKDIDRWVEQIEGTIGSLLSRIEVAYESAPKKTRKSYAIWMKEQEPELFKYMFARADGKDLLPLIYKCAF